MLLLANVLFRRRRFCALLNCWCASDSDEDMFARVRLNCESTYNWAFALRSKIRKYVRTYVCAHIGGQSPRGIDTAETAVDPQRDRHSQHECACAKSRRSIPRMCELRLRPVRKDRPVFMNSCMILRLSMMSKLKFEILKYWMFDNWNSKYWITKILNA